MYKKSGIFLIAHFGRHANEGGYSPPRSCVCGRQMNVVDSPVLKHSLISTFFALRSCDRHFGEQRITPL